MGIDYSLFAIPKSRDGKIRVEAQRDKRLSNEEKERACRAEVKRRYGVCCAVPGCREKGEQHHIEPRSTAPRRKYDPTNRRPICRAHHELIHRGKLDAYVDADGEFIVTGPRKYLEFTL